MKKKKFKFDVGFLLNALTSVPYVSGVIFAKMRLLDGGSFADFSTRKEVQNHCVKWNTNFKFPCKMTASAANGVLDVCRCRVSVRKETKGGKSHIKLGFVDINLAEFAGSGTLTRRYILEGYDDKTSRQDNSILEIQVTMQLISGDPLFKVPGTPRQSRMNVTETEENRAPQPEATTGPSLSRKSSGEESRKSSFSSNTASATSPVGTAGGTLNDSQLPFTPGHVRSSSEPPIVGHVRSASLHSRISGYSTGPSVSSSLEGQQRVPSQSGTAEPIHSSSEDTGICDSEHTLSPSSVRSRKGSSSQHDWRKSIEDKKGSSHSRVDAEDIVDQILKGQEFISDDFSGDGNEISLHFANDGTLSGRISKPVPDYADKYRTL
ncbi:protein FAM102B [Nematostella vectensis]|uniref:protein FAM102B n=1 Tax=Nematostella vectensis TaxID=45351 RepID=UPI00138FD7DB|nr:protein FAM102B [Nematostella vectensis]